MAKTNSGGDWGGGRATLNRMVTAGCLDQVTCQSSPER